GIGEKTAMKLVGQFGTVEDLLGRTAELTGKQKENVEKNRELAVISKKLATIHCDVPFPVELEKLKIQPFDEEKLKALFIEFEFNSIGRRLFGEAFKAGRGSPAPATPNQAASVPSAPARQAVQEDLVLTSEETESVPS